MSTKRLTVLYVGSSLLSPLRQAEVESARTHGIELRVAAHNLGAPLEDAEWEIIERGLSAAEIVFVIHVTDGENAARLLPLIAKYESQHRAVIVINCMPALMRLTRMGRLTFGGARVEETMNEGKGAGGGKARQLVRDIGSWMAVQARARRGKGGGNHTQYLRYVERLPSLLKLVPNAGRLGDFKHYLQLFCYFLQPTPANVRSMLLYALKHYAPDPRLSRLSIPQPEAMPSVGVYHPDAPSLFKNFAEYRAWHDKRARRLELARLEPAHTIGLLLMRPQIVSGATGHYDGLIRQIEAEGLAVLPVISTFMDNREACAKFFVEDSQTPIARSRFSVVKDKSTTTDNGQRTTHKSRVSQLVSLTGFSFVGGPAMNDSEAAVEFLRGLNVPFRTAVSLDVQTIESWRESWTGLNPVQAGMQIAIPEIDGATEPYVFGGLSAASPAPQALEDRCLRITRRLKRWQRLQSAPRAELKLALVLFCFPSDKGNIGTAADLDVFPSLWEMLCKLRDEGYNVEVPSDADELRMRLLEDAEGYGTPARVAYRMTVEEYRRLCPYAGEIDGEWGRAPGEINSFGGTLLVQGIQLGNVFVGVQPTFGYEGDPMRMMMARGSAPHHGFAAFYTYLEKVFRADAVVHVGTHGALEFMPGKGVGLSGECWPDRLIGELPHVYAYSVNNPSEGSIARRRSYAELISYLTPPVEDAGVYRELASFKELLATYRQSSDEGERERLFGAIEAQAETLHFETGPASPARAASH